MGQSLNAPFTELRRTGQEAAKTEIFKARAAMHYAQHHAGPAGRNLTALILPVLRANYVCSENIIIIIIVIVDTLHLLLSSGCCHADMHPKGANANK